MVFTEIVIASLKLCPWSVSQSTSPQKSSQTESNARPRTSCPCDGSWPWRSPGNCHTRFSWAAAESWTVWSPLLGGLCFCLCLFLGRWYWLTLERLCLSKGRASIEQMSWVRCWSRLLWRKHYQRMFWNDFLFGVFFWPTFCFLLGTQEYNYFCNFPQ